MSIETIVGILFVLAVLVGIFFLVKNVILPRFRDDGGGGRPGGPNDTSHR